MQLHSIVIFRLNYMPVPVVAQLHSLGVCRLRTGRVLFGNLNLLIGAFFKSTAEGTEILQSASYLCGTIATRLGLQLLNVVIRMIICRISLGYTPIFFFFFECWCLDLATVLPINLYVSRPFQYVAKSISFPLYGVGLLQSSGE